MNIYFFSFSFHAVYVHGCVCLHLQVLSYQISASQEEIRNLEVTFKNFPFSTSFYFSWKVPFIFLYPHMTGLRQLNYCATVVMSEIVDVIKGTCNFLWLGSFILVCVCCFVSCTSQFRTFFSVCHLKDSINHFPISSRFPSLPGVHHLVSRCSLSTGFWLQWF